MLRILLLSKEPLTEVAQDTLYEWLYQWGAHPLCRSPGEIEVQEVALHPAPGVRFQWSRWRSRIKYHWLVVVGAEAAKELRQSNDDGLLGLYGMPSTVLPDPLKVPFLEERYHTNCEDYVKQIFKWVRMS